jgi:ABC-type polysaccharide/polyol phosphate export permease
MSSARQLVARRELLWNLTLREMRGRYKRSVLGWAWSMLNPLATMLIYTFVFSVVVSADPPVGDPSGLDNYAMFLLCGYLPWSFFAVSTSVAIQSIVANGRLVQKVAFPREHLVVSVVGAGLVTFLIELTVLCIALLVLGNMVLPWIPVVIGLSAILAVFATGFGLAVAAANVFFRDLTYLWSIISQAWFFATPLVYPAFLVEDKVPGWAFSIYQHLPMAVIVRTFRSVLYDTQWPALGDVGLMAVYAAVVFAAGWWIFDHLEPRFAEEL